ncbi:hypothetical protein CMT41_03590 [Colwellia sp. MT41]|nr:hypothetical protein CMT41_03590 [Colwellia sp. MT41]
MAEQKPKESLPSRGKKWVAHIGQIELIIKSLGSLLTSIQKVIFPSKSFGSVYAVHLFYYFLVKKLIGRLLVL